MKTSIHPKKYNALSKALLQNPWFHVFSLAALVLIIASFLVPPTGVIDNSVLAAVGEIFAFAALGTVIHALDQGMEAKITKGDTSVIIGDIDKDGEAADED